MTGIGFHKNISLKFTNKVRNASHVPYQVLNYGHIGNFEILSINLPYRVNMNNNRHIYDAN